MKFKRLQLLLFLSSLLIGLSLYPQKKVTVIGAGLAGLSAAHRLKKNGFEVEIYEARQRPGGRVFTCYFTNGYSELGGMNIHDGGAGTTLKALADELKVPYHEYFARRDFSYYTPQGKLVDYNNFLSNMPIPTDELYSRLKQCTSIAQALDILFGTNDSIAKRFFTLRSQQFEGCECSKLSMFYLDSFWSYYCANYQHITLNKSNISSSSFCTIKNGMRHLVEALCASLTGCIHYGMPLKKIYRDKNKQLIIEVGDQHVRVDKLVLALPCSTLKDVAINTGIIPNDQTDMINTLQYGTNAKILIPTTGKSERCCGAHNDCFIFNQSPVVWLYFGGKEGIFDSQTLPTYFERQIPALKELYPEVTFDTQIMSVPNTTNSFVTMKNQPVGISWINEPYSKGSYSCLAQGQEKAYEKFSEYCGENVRTAFRPVQNRIFFAGEHTSLDNPATMEGAVESGERAARMVNFVCRQK